MSKKNKHKNKQPHGLDHGSTCVCIKCKVFNNNKIEHKTIGVHNKTCVCSICIDNIDDEEGHQYVNGGASLGLGHQAFKPKPYVKPPPCHEGNTKAFMKDGIQVWGGGTNKDVDPFMCDVVLDLTHGVRENEWSESIPTGWKSKALKSDTIILDFFITDMSAPTNATREFWEILWKDLKKFKTKGKTLNVLAMCIGGHGRTGTVLTALMVASGYNKIVEGNPIKWLRENYCHKAVESKRQTDYLSSLWPDDIHFIEPAKQQSFIQNKVDEQKKLPGLNGDDDDEWEMADDKSKCKTCDTTRTAQNRVMWEKSIKGFECDDCNTKRMRKLGQELGDEEEEDDEDCGGEECEFTIIDEVDENLEFIEILTHTYDNGCTATKGDDEETPIHSMTDAEFSN